jgi:hypothetical protein
LIQARVPLATQAGALAEVVHEPPENNMLSAL